MDQPWIIKKKIASDTERQLNDGPTGKSLLSIYLFIYFFFFTHSFTDLSYFATGIYENETEK